MGPKIALLTTVHHVVGDSRLHRRASQCIAFNAGTDLRNISEAHPACLELLLNPDIVAVNQDPAALPPRLVWQHPPPSTANITSGSITAQAFARPLSNGKLAVVMLNRQRSGVATLAVTWEQLGLPREAAMSVYDVVARRHAANHAAGTFSAAVPSHDVSFVVLSPL